MPRLRNINHMTKSVHLLPCELSTSMLQDFVTSFCSWPGWVVGFEGEAEGAWG